MPAYQPTSVERWLKSTRTLVLFVLVVGGVTAVVVTGVYSRGVEPMLVAVACMCGALFVWNIVTSTILGIKRHVVRHLGDRWSQGEIVNQTFQTGQRVNLQLALDRLSNDPRTGGPVFGLPRGGLCGHGGEVRGLTLLIHSNPEPSPLDYDNLPRSPGQSIGCVGNGLYLLRIEGEPVCVLVAGCKEGKKMPARVLALARTRARAQAVVDLLVRTAREESVYRGAVVSLAWYDRATEDFGVQFHDLPAARRDEIVLPDEVLQVIERNVVGHVNHADALRQAGCGVRHGVLLHGPPGTGKTLVTRWLTRACPRCTVLVLTGKQYAFLRPTCRLAAEHAPSLVILDDVDLIAAHRRHNRRAPLLHELLDEMDGLGALSECVFLLTTNRPEAVETALAARPGRVDQAVYFPLPDLDCRRRLFVQFGKGLDLSGVDVEPLLRRTEGASPAFIKELFRRVVLMAAERGERSQPARVAAADFERALRELLEFGGDLTRNFLGFPAVASPGPS
jgi:hypothetical protein